jgi:hypothetical protein
MQLNNINDELCSTCNAQIVAETKRNRHCNGQWNESRSFECGAILRWSPNFSSLHDCSPCPNSKDQIKFKKRRVNAKVKLEIFVNNLSVDDHMKDRITSAVEYL